MEFKIGDRVTYLFEGGEFEIIASKTVPYTTKSGRKITPLNDADFVLASLKISDEMIPFVYANKEHLDIL